MFHHADGHDAVEGSADLAVVELLHIDGCIRAPVSCSANLFDRGRDAGDDGP